MYIGNFPTQITHMKLTLPTNTTYKFTHFVLRLIVDTIICRLLSYLFTYPTGIYTPT